MTDNKVNFKSTSPCALIAAIRPAVLTFGATIAAPTAELPWRESKVIDSWAEGVGDRPRLPLNTVELKLLPIRRFAVRDIGPFVYFYIACN